MNCDKIQLLLSKYADNEVSASEREMVRAHVAGCASCARKLTEFEQVHALFASAPTLPPEPQLRVGLFREINLIKEEDVRKARRARENGPWYLPASVATVIRRFGLAWLRSSFNLVAVAVLAVLTFSGLVLLSRGPTAPQAPKDDPRQAYAPPVPTLAVFEDGTSGVIDSRGVPGTLMPPASLVSATVPPSGTGDGIISLSNPTPVLEDLNATGTSVHTVRDAVYGYSIEYPANWWTQLVKGVRYFRPWKGGEAAPYWIELRVDPNDRNYTAETYNRDQFEGKGTLLPGAEGSPARLRNATSDADNHYDDLLTFDREHIYTLRLSVPNESTLPGFGTRWEDAEAVFSGMSGRTSLAQERPQLPGYGSTLFLYGSDLYSVSMSGQAQAVARGSSLQGVIKQFALSPDLSAVAFTSAKQSADRWGRALYVSNFEGDTPGQPDLLWDGATEIRDLAWYSERVLLVIARAPQGSGIYRLTLPAKGQPFDPSTMVQRIADLSQGLAGATGLAVAPDRQLITFLAPIGAGDGTNIYAIRPDGSDLRLLVAHSVPVAPSESGTRLLSPEDQAIKSYVWLDGHLERRGYRYSLLFTCGNALYPSQFRGGFLYSAPGTGNAHTSILDSGQLADLGISDLAKFEIVHIAYSSDSRVAMTGYYNDADENQAYKLAGLWVADVHDGQLTDIQAEPLPSAPNGIADLQWSPDNSSLVYRETISRAPESYTDRYDGTSPFKIVKLDVTTGTRTTLFDRSQAR